MSSEKQSKQLILTEYDLQIIKDLAHKKFIEESTIPRMEGSSFVVYCWINSIIEFLNRNNYTNIQIKKLNEKIDHDSED